MSLAHQSASPSPPSVNNSMDLDTFFSVTHDNVDFAKACSLVKTNPTTNVEAEFLHQFNLSIHNLEQEV